MNEKRNVSSSGDILNINTNIITTINNQFQIATPTDLKINQLNPQNIQRLKILSPSSRDSQVQVQWREQDSQVYDFSVNSPEMKHQQKVQLQKGPPRDVHSAKKQKSRFLASRKSLISQNGNQAQATASTDLEMLPIHSKESFVVQLIQRAKDSQVSSVRNKHRQIFKNNNHQFENNKQN